jgi:hypothetical protein
MTFMKTQMALKAMAEANGSQQKATEMLNRIMAEARQYLHSRKSNRRDRTGWLGWEDSNSRVQRSRLSSMA